MESVCTNILSDTVSYDSLLNSHVLIPSKKGGNEPNVHGSATATPKDNDDYDSPRSPSYSVAPKTYEVRETSHNMVDEQGTSMPTCLDQKKAILVQENQERKTKIKTDT